MVQPWMGSLLVTHSSRRVRLETYDLPTSLAWGYAHRARTSCLEGKTFVLAETMAHFLEEIIPCSYHDALILIVEGNEYCLRVYNTFTSNLMLWAHEDYFILSLNYS